MKTRLYKWDNIKGILIFLVVLGHLADRYTEQFAGMRSLYLFIYTFHMPLFIFITGMFSKRIVKERDYPKIISYFFVYIVSKALSFIVNFSPSKDNTFDLFFEGQVPWYAFAIFVFLIISIQIKDISSRYMLFFSIVLAMLIGYDQSIGPYLVMSRIIVFFPFFYAGLLSNPKKTLRLVDDIKIKIGSGVFLLIVAVVIYLNIDKLYFLRALLTGQNPFSHLAVGAAYGALFQLLYYGFATIMSISIIAIIPKGKFILTLIGQRSLAVYVMHYPIILLFYRLVDVTGIIQSISPRYYVLFIFPIAIVLTLVCTCKPIRQLVATLTTVKIN